MFDLERGERALVAVLVVLLAVGIGLSWHLRSRRLPLPVRSTGAVLPAERTAADAPVRNAVNINTASADELASLPGIGTVLAGRIVADRAARGPFLSKAELARVKGIGPRLVGRLGDDITVE